MSGCAAREGAVVRTARTLTLYASLGCLGYLLTGLGTVLPELRVEYGLPRAEAALYPLALAVGLLLAGFGGHRVARRIGRPALPAAMVALIGGALVLAAGSGRLSAAAGAVLLGLGGAGLIQLVPAALQAEHGADGGTGGTVAIGEANGVASAASVLAPLVIGVAVGHSLGWRLGFLVPPLLVSLILLTLLGRDLLSIHGQGRESAPGPPIQAAGQAKRDVPEAAPRAFWVWWTDLVLVVGIEFCVLFWCVDFLRTDKGLMAGTATVASAAFVLGMAIGRAATGPVVQLARGPVSIMAGAAGAALVGITGFWAVPSPAAATACLLLAGLGVALLYPVAVGQALGAWTSRPERAAARCALASGLAIGAAPFVLGLLADAVGLRTAMLLAPFLLLVVLTRSAHRARPGSAL